MDDILQELGQTPKQLVDELENDLVKLINKHSFMGVSTPPHTLPLCGWTPIAAIRLTSLEKRSQGRDRSCVVVLDGPRRGVGSERSDKCMHVQVVSAACKTLASLAARADSAAESLTASAQNYLAALRQSSTSHSVYCSR